MQKLRESKLFVPNAIHRLNVSPKVRDFSVQVLLNLDRYFGRFLILRILRHDLLLASQENILDAPAFANQCL